MRQYHYINDAGEFDYEGYRAVQTAGNKSKIGLQWATEESIAYLSDYIRRKICFVGFGICHGTRRGLEQAWFRQYLGCEVIGTEISDTADQFPNTIQWDFHETKPEWIGAVDFIYSNSWDHSYDPVKLFTAWMSCIRPGGICILEHTPDHVTPNELDPLGMTIDEMVSLIDHLGSEKWAVCEILRGGPLVGLVGTEAKADYVVIQSTRLANGILSG